MLPEVTLYRILYRSPKDGAIIKTSEWLETKPLYPPEHSEVISISATPSAVVYDNTTISPNTTFFVNNGHWTGTVVDTGTDLAILRHDLDKNLDSAPRFSYGSTWSDIGLEVSIKDFSAEDTLYNFEVIVPGYSYVDKDAVKIVTVEHATSVNRDSYMLVK